MITPTTQAAIATLKDISIHAARGHAQLHAPQAAEGSAEQTAEGRIDISLLDMKQKSFTLNLFT